MNDDVEAILKQLAPRGAGPTLRARVLDAVAEQLPAAECHGQTRGAMGSLPALARRRWDRWAAASVAALVLVGAGLNFWAARTGTARLAAIYGPPPVPRYISELADTIASVTDAETGRRFREQFLSAQRPRGTPPEVVMRHYQQMLEAILLVEKGSYYEAVQEDPEMDRDRSRGSGGDTSYHERRPCPDHRFTA